MRWICVVTAGLLVFVLAASVEADVRWRSVEELVESADVIASGKVTKIDEERVGDEKWKVATVEIDKVILDRSPKSRKIASLKLYVAPIRRRTPGVPETGMSDPVVREGQSGIWFFQSHVNFVGYRASHDGRQHPKRLKRIEAAIAAQKDPMKAMRSDDVRARVAGAYYWAHSAGAPDRDKKTVRGLASKETTRLVEDAIAAGLGVDPMKDRELHRLARHVVGELSFPYREIFPVGTRAGDHARKFSEWRAAHPDFRLVEFVEADEK